MAIQLNQEIKQYLKEHHQELLNLIETLCKIPAPSNHEEKRAAFIKAWLEARGAEGVYIDEALNVVYPHECEGKNSLTVLMAHTDTVFPDMEPFTVTYDGNRMCCPGVGDDTTNLAMLLMDIQYVLENKLHSESGVLFVANAGEEGLGNLKGCRQIMKDYEGRVAELTSFDGSYDGVCNYAVGSKRYHVTLQTEGGHSYGAFGNRNAIHLLSSMIDTLYTLKVPAGGKSTYNVGTIHGGTSVNTIAQSAEMLFEYRSDVKEHLAMMDDFFHKVIASYQAMDIPVTVELVGDRPCMGDVDPAKQDALNAKVFSFIKELTGKEAGGHSGSTDCNIPFSLGIPAICFGGYKGHGAHTREEYIELDSLETGFQIVTAHVLSYFE